MREQKGITLVALIITVIIMMILVGVSLRFVIDGGLTGTTQNAVSETNEEKKYEEDLSKGKVQQKNGTWMNLSDL